MYSMIFHICVFDDALWEGTRALVIEQTIYLSVLWLDDAMQVLRATAGFDLF